ncbi:MAG: Smr/MutS family protein [Bacteroidetes bacterium]|nr:Smr/MutS family protein [Bacteroidota bacterium]
MKLRIGDKVKFLNEVGEGTVTRIKDNLHVFVEMNDGFEIPYPAKQLVPIHNELIIHRESENIELEANAQIADAIYFVVEPDHDLPQLMNDYKIYLFNASSYNLLYTYSIKDDAYYQTLKHGEVGAFQKILLKQVKLPFFNEFNFHKTECLLFKNGHYKSQLPFVEILHITPKVLSGAKPIKHQEFKHQVFAFLIKDQFSQTDTTTTELSLIDIARLKTIKEFKTKAKVSKSQKEYLKSLEREIDLHIEELVENPNELSSHEKFTIQLERFEKELDKAFEENVKKIIFIHGVGNGKLKHEIVSRLKHIKGITFHDAPLKNFGVGATQINI